MWELGDCEVCNAREAVGAFDLCGVESELCEHCAYLLWEDGKVAIYNGMNEH